MEDFVKYLTRASMTQRIPDSPPQPDQDAMVIDQADLRGYFRLSKSGVLEHERDDEDGEEASFELRCNEDFDSDLEEEPEPFEKMRVTTPIEPPKGIRVPINIGLDELKVLSTRPEPRAVRRMAHKQPRKAPRRADSPGGDDPNLVEYFGRWPDLSPQSRIAIARTYANYLAACLRAENMG